MVNSPSMGVSSFGNFANVANSKLAFYHYYAMKTQF